MTTNVTPTNQHRVRASKDATHALPEKSPWLLRGFTRFARWQVTKHFHALRLASPGSPEITSDRPLLIYLNHPAWWDPLIGLMLADMCFPQHSHYAPIDAVALKQYAFFQKLGFFGIDTRQRSGSTRFLTLGQQIMSSPANALWVTAQGEFTDPRQRPVTLRPGVAHLARRLDHGLIVPLALEYPFWTEKKPEALAQFGTPIELAQISTFTTEQWQDHLTSALQQTMDQLASLAKRQDNNDWHTLLTGRVGTTPAYDLYRATRAAIKGQRFHRAHREISHNA